MELNFDEIALVKAMRTEETKSLVMEKTNRAADIARGTGPQTRNPSYVPSIRTTWDLTTSPEGPEVYSGYVIASRHEMVIEFGWHDLKGRWHPGKFNLTKALKKVGKE